MHVSLTPELTSRVKAKVESGLYNNASEVIRDALRFMETHEELVYQMKLEALRNKLAVGTEQLDQGEGMPIENKQQAEALFEDIKSTQG